MEKTCQSCLTLCTLQNNRRLSHHSDDGGLHNWDSEVSDQRGHEPWLFRLTRDGLPTCSGSCGRRRETASQSRTILKAILKFYFHKVWCGLQLCRWLLAPNQSIMVLAREEFDETSAVLKVLVWVFRVRLRNGVLEPVLQAVVPQNSEFFFISVGIATGLLPRWWNAMALRETNHLTMNLSSRDRVCLLACLHLRLNLWDHWKPNKYHLPVSGSTGILHDILPWFRLNTKQCFFDHWWWSNHWFCISSQRRQVEWALGERHLWIFLDCASELRQIMNIFAFPLPYLYQDDVMETSRSSFVSKLRV